MPADPAACLQKARRIVLLVGLEPVPAGVAEGLAREIASLAPEREMIIVPRTSLSFSAALADPGPEQGDVPRLQAQAAVSTAGVAAGLHTALAQEGLSSALVTFSRSDLASRRRYLHIRNTLFELLKNRVVPLLFPNRTTSGQDLEEGRTTELGALAASLLKADLLLIRGGGLSAPGEKAVEKAVRAGVPVFVQTGQGGPGLADLAAGLGQGIFREPPPVLLDPNRWEALTLASRGGLTVSPSYARRLRRDSIALALEDVVEVRGRFDQGAQINLLDRDGNVLAVGLSNYSSARLSALKTLKPGDIRDKLGYIYYCCVIREENITLPRGEGGPACLLPA